MKKYEKYILLFLAGGVGYGIIEFIWRGHTHVTMIIAGGICLVAFSIVEKLLSDAPLILRSAICASFVTLVELIFGLIFNVILKWGVWDYGNLPYNLFGQICPTYSLLWWALAFVSLPIVRLTNKKIAL